MWLHDDPASDIAFSGYEDFEVQDAEDRQQADAWLRRLPWLTERERSRDALAKHPAYPVACANEPDYNAFAVRLRRDSERRVPCVFDMGWGKVRGAFDLVSGAAFLLEDGQYRLADELSQTVDITFADATGAYLYQVEVVNGFANVLYVDTSFDANRTPAGELLAAEAQQVPVYSLGDVVEALARINKLPPVTASANRRRFGTYHPL
jgi:hypothetical protein